MGYDMSADKMKFSDIVVLIVGGSSFLYYLIVAYPTAFKLWATIGWDGWLCLGLSLASVMYLVARKRV